MQRAIENAAGTKLVTMMPITGLPVAKVRQLIPTIKRLFPCRVLIVVHSDHPNDPSQHASFKMAAAISKCGPRPPRRTLVGVASGGAGTLKTLAFCAMHGLRLIMLDGSSELALRLATLALGARYRLARSSLRSQAPCLSVCSTYPPKG